MNFDRIIKVSIVVCVYNEEKYLRRCLDALCTQTYPPGDYEIIIIDDDSTDASARIAKDVILRRKSILPHITYCRIENRGLSRARNAGIYRAKGEFIFFIDGDAIAHKNWISALVKPFYGNPAIGVCGGKVDILNSEVPFARYIHYMYYERDNNERGQITGTNMAYRKQVFQDFGGFFSIFELRGDESIVNKLITQKWQYAIVPEAIVYHERPVRLSEWLKTRYENGYFGVLYDMAVSLRCGKQIPMRKKLAVVFLNRVFTMLFWPSLLLSLVIPIFPIWVCLFVTSLFSFVRHIGRGSLLREIKRLRKARKQNNYKLLWDVGIYLLGFFYLDFGTVIGILRFMQMREATNKIEVVTPKEIFRN